VVLSGDTSPCEAVSLAAYQADLLVHEATFAAPELERARETGHSTAAQAALLAKAAEVQMLALTHLSSRYPAGVLIDEAREVFPDSYVARDFDQVELPLPERGRPELKAWERRWAAPEDPAALASGEFMADPHQTAPPPAAAEEVRSSS
jgi:ribonuclease Z